MNLFSKKKSSLVPKKAASPSLSKQGANVKAVAMQTSLKIKKGLSQTTASTGTPIAALHGGPKFMAQMSNIGGGSVATGGGGIKDGFKTVLDYAGAASVLNAEPSQSASKAKAAVSTISHRRPFPKLKKGSKPKK